LDALAGGLVWGRPGVFMPVGVMIVGVDRPSFA
jgi:hypothetical protein